MDENAITQRISEQWDQIKNTASSMVNDTPVAYDTWVAPLTFASYANNAATILIPEKNANVFDYIVSKYTPVMKVALSEAVGRDSNIDILFEMADAMPVVPEDLPEAADADPFNNVETSSSVDADPKANLNPRYRFDTFVVGSNNNFAHSASLAVAESPGKAYNPLFLWGGPGLGKTHLMHSIAHIILDESPSAKVLYVTSEQFTNEVIESIRISKTGKGSLPPLREKYRTVDVLMVDDVQFIIGKEATQLEFFHTFNELHQAGKQIVISSDRPPKELESLDDRLKSRFEMGLVADIQPPNYETRMAILRKNAENSPYPVNNEVFEYIAENITSNIRELEGAYNKIIANARISEGPLTLDAAKAILTDLIDPSQSRALSMNSIIDAVCEYYHISRDDIVSKKRMSEIVLPRQVAMFLCRFSLSNSLEDIGRCLGGKDHTTVINGVHKIQSRLQSDMELRRNIEALCKTLGIDLAIVNQ